MVTRLNRLAEAVLTSTHNLCFEQEYEKISFFLSENLPVLVEKFSIYLNRHVFEKRVATFLSVAAMEFWIIYILLKTSYQF